MLKICKRLMIFFSMVLISPTLFANETPNIPEPKVAAQAAILVDAKTGQVLWGKKMHTPMPMASTTKIMTAIICLERTNLSDVVTVSSRASLAPRVKMNLKKGQKIRVEDLLYALMLESANDAAVALAEHIAGSVDAFCQMMTEKAIEIGAFQTSYKTPNGLDAKDHYSTAYDLAQITRYALANEKLLSIIGTPSVDLPISGGNFTSYHLNNKNRLLKEYSGAYGVKTGFTGLAGQCFIGAAKRDPIDLITVVLASGWGARGREQKWVDSKRLLDYGFTHYNYHQLIEKNTKLTDLEIEGSKQRKVNLYTEKELVLLLTKDDLQTIKTKVYVDADPKAPVKKNQALGHVSVYVKDQLIAKVDLVSDRSVYANTLEKNLKKILNSWMNMGNEPLKENP